MPNTLSERLAKRYMDAMNESVEQRNKEEKTVDPIVLDLGPDSALPTIRAIVTEEGKTVSDITITCTALIISPLNKVLYVECVTSSSSTAHAIMGGISDPRTDPIWTFNDNERLIVPDAAAVADTRLPVPNYNGSLHHVAILDKSGDLVLSKDQEQTWMKLRSKMTCPSLPKWGKDLMPKIIRDGILLECQHFGIPKEFTPFVLAPDASSLFDEIIGQHVRKVGLPDRTESS